MFGAGAFALDGDGGADAAVVAKRFFKHALAHLRGGLETEGFVGRLGEGGILEGKASALSRAAVLELFELVVPGGVGPQTREATVRSAASLDLFVLMQATLTPSSPVNPM